MARFIVLVALPGGRTAERDKKLDLAMGQHDFSMFFTDRGERFYLPAGSYHHDQSDVYKTAEEAHVAATRVAQSIDPLAAVVLIPFEDIYYTGTSEKRAQAMAKFELRDRVIVIGSPAAYTVEEIRQSTEPGNEPLYWIQLGSNFKDRTYHKESELEPAP
jgi:hypothetical protein